MTDLTKVIKAYKEMKEASRRLEAVKPNHRDYEYYKEKFESAEENYTKASAKVQDICDTANGRARERIITIEKIINSIDNLEQQIKCPKKYLEGLKVWVNPFEQNVPSAYKYKFESTTFELAFEKGKWKLIEVCRKDTKYVKHFNIDFSNCDCTEILKTWRFF